MLAPHFNCTVVNVHIISHMGLGEGFDYPKVPMVGSVIVKGAVSCRNGFWGLIAMAISPSPLGLHDPSQR